MEQQINVENSPDKQRAANATGTILDALPLLLAESAPCWTHCASGDRNSRAVGNGHQTSELDKAQF
jgi:hypothetical protein